MVEATAQLLTYNRRPITVAMTAEAEDDAVAQFDLRRGMRVAAEFRSTIDPIRRPLGAATSVQAPLCGPSPA